MKGRKKRVVLIPALALRNCMRNKRRTLLSGSSIALVAFAICLLFSFEEGFLSDMKRNVINDVTGNVRVRTADYSENERILPLQYFIPDTDGLVQRIENLDGVTGIEARILSPASIYRNDTIETAILTGIPADSTKLFSNRNTLFLEGTPVRGGMGKKEAVITKTLSDSLNLHAGDKFTFFTRTATGGSNGATFTVSAVVLPGDTDFNTMRCFLDWKDLSHLLRMEGNATELLVYTKELSSGQTELLIHTIQSLGESHDAPAPKSLLEVLPWEKTGSIYALFGFADAIYFFIGVVFFLLASTVIFNTTMMSVLERRKEIGTLMSLGMKKPDIFTMIMLEILMTAGTAAAAGISAASVFITVWHVRGFNMYAAGGSAVAGMNISSWIYPSLSLYRYILIFVTGVCIAVAACMGPARQALRIEPAEALRTEN